MWNLEKNQNQGLPLKLGHILHHKAMLTSRIKVLTMCLLKTLFQFCYFRMFHLQQITLGFFQCIFAAKFTNKMATSGH